MATITMPADEILLGNAGQPMVNPDPVPEEATKTKTMKVQNSFVFEATSPGTGDYPLFVDVNLMEENKFSILSSGNGIFDVQGIKALRKNLKWVLNQHKALYGEVKEGTEVVEVTELDNFEKGDLITDDQLLKAAEQLGANTNPSYTFTKILPDEEIVNGYDKIDSSEDGVEMLMASNVISGSSPLTKEEFMEALSSINVNPSS